MADAFGPSTGMSTALGAAILLPALASARQVANKTASAANMHGLYLSMYTWSINNRDKFPEDLTILVKDGSASIRHFLNPNSGTSIPPEVQAALVKKDWPTVSKWIKSNPDYIYRPNKGSASKADAIIMYERFDAEAEGANVLYGDGHVEFLDMIKLIQELKRVGEKLPAGVK
jgi:prepilin-type processing-associated H-X9-DG protein